MARARPGASGRAAIKPPARDPKMIAVFPQYGEVDFRIGLGTLP
jgi:hypothetical protein